MKSIYQGDIYMSIFIIAVSTIGKIQDQPKDEWIIKMYTLNEAFFNHRKKEFPCSKVDGTKSF
jgi:hypothetical protein